jgi:hypothetical protein
MRIFAQTLGAWREAVQKTLYRYRRLHRLTYIPQLLLQGILGLFLIGASFGFENQVASVYLPMTGGILDILLAAYEPARSFYGFAKKAERFEQAYDQVEQVLVDIRFQLCLPMDSRSSLTELTYRMQESITVLVDLEKAMPESILKDLQRKRTLLGREHKNSHIVPQADQPAVHEVPTVNYSSSANPTNEDWP